MMPVGRRPQPRRPGRRLARCPSWFVTLAVCALVASGCQKHVEASPQAERSIPVSGNAVSARAGSANDDGQWTMPGKDFENTRYSSLDQLTNGNVKDLRLVWTRSTGATRGHEA